MAAQVVVIIIMEGGSDSKPIFHDFFSGDLSGELTSAKGGENRCDVVEGSISGSVSASTLVSVGLSSDVGSERRGVNNSEVFHFHGRKSDISGSELNNSFPGRKRSFYDSAFTGLLDRHRPAGSDSFERSSILKMARPQGDGIMFPVQSPAWPNSIVSRIPSSTRPDSLVSTHVPASPTGHILYRPSRLSQGGLHTMKASSSYDIGDNNARAMIISSSTADEGSRTGIRGCGFNETVNPTGSEVGHRNLVSILSRSKVSGDAHPGSGNTPRCNVTASSTRQMTIFYGGQAHVFDDVHPNKADMIMALASSGGGAWTTTYSNKLTDLTTKAKSNVGTQEEIPVDKNVNDVSRLAQKQPANDGPSLQHDGGKGSVSDRDQMPTTQELEVDEGKREA